MTEPTSVLAQLLGILPEDPEAAVLCLLIELAAQVVGAEEGSLLVVDRGEDPARSLVFAMTVGSHESERVLNGQRIPIGEGLTGLAALTREVQVGAPLYDGIRQAERGEASSEQPRSVIAAPMLIGDTLVGVITAVSFEVDKRFSSADAELYARAASVAGVVVDQHNRLAAKVDTAAAEGQASADAAIEEAVFASVERLVNANRGHLADLSRSLAALEALNAVKQK